MDKLRKKLGTCPKRVKLFKALEFSSSFFSLKADGDDLADAIKGKILAAAVLPRIVKRVMLSSAQNHLRNLK